MKVHHFLFFILFACCTGKGWAADWPVAWATYHPVVSPEADAEDLLRHGVRCISSSAKTVSEARAALALARRFGLQYFIEIPELTENEPLVRANALAPVRAVMIGGVYRGLAIDRHLFAFAAAPQRIVIEPPVYSAGFPYEKGKERIGHYFNGLEAPLRAEVVVPLKPFDGAQHLQIIPAVLTPAPAGAKPQNDSVKAADSAVPEIQNRTLYQLTFDLTGLDAARLDQVGLAVYWQSSGKSDYWMFGQGQLSAGAESTREALRREIRKRLAIWSEAAGGAFPADTVIAVRVGDECFNITGHLGLSAGSLPLWDYSEPLIAAFAKRMPPGATYPRTWGYPEIYGAAAYARWLYGSHQACAELIGLARDEIHRLAPGVLVMRNTTRGGVFSVCNDHDGSGQELLARVLDVVHLDPYPVSASGYHENILEDMGYCAGLARRYHRPLIPWMQAHTYGGPSGLQHVTPDQVDRMAAEQRLFAPDAVMWLGYGYTFPKVQPQSWERAAAFHAMLANHPLPKPKAELAVLRPYRVWALSTPVQGGIRNPADWILQQFLYVWAVEMKRPYDVFEIPPDETPAETAARDRVLKAYPRIVSLMPYPGAEVVGENTEGTILSTAQASSLRAAFRRAIK